MISLFQENQMVPLSQRRALLKYCGEQYRKSNTTYQECAADVVILTEQYHNSYTNIAISVLQYRHCILDLNKMKLC